MLTICPLSQAPDARTTCINWTDAEWGAVARFAPEDWEAEISRIEGHPVDEVFVAFKNEAPVGMAWILEHEGVESHAHLSPWLSSLVVDPDHRNQGIAAALIRHVEDYAALGGDDHLFLLTHTPAVYFTKGWEVHDTAPLGRGHVFVMQKALPENDQQPDD
ncbi:MAG: GNAT superfamily N-acetyltransferase [Paracoccaceae bacterium]|jgi:GNAT superfamily N-acetyltransferase